MSTAASPNIGHLSHTPHTAHPLPLREQAFTLHCQGLRSPAIAAELGVPERTIRAWIAAVLDDLKDDLQLNRRQQLLLAVERQHQFTATAWQQFQREASARDALLDAALQTLLATSDASSSAGTSAAHSSRLHLPASTPAPRYLSLILQANKETNRLLGLHSLAHLHLLTPEASAAADSPDALAADPDTPAESATPPAQTQSPAKTATGATRQIAAESATADSAPSPAPAFRPRVERAPAFQGRDSSRPAESATAPAAPPLSPAFRPTALAPAVYGRDSSLPAKTATATVASGLATRIGTLANRHITKKPQPWMM